MLTISFNHLFIDYARKNSSRVRALNFPGGFDFVDFLSKRNKILMIDNKIASLTPKAVSDGIDYTLLYIKLKFGLLGLASSLLCTMEGTQNWDKVLD